MARKSSQGTSPSRGLSGGLVLVGLIIIIGVIVLEEFTGIDLTQIIVDAEPTFDAAVQQDGTGAGGGQDSGRGDYFSVYFTTPIIPDNDTRSGGIDGRLVEAIAAAQNTIDIAAFEFNLQSVADALLAAQARGVRVRMVDDDEHTEDSQQMEEIRDAGIPVVDDERSALMHNKFIVIDGVEVWSGSMNFTENGVYRNNNNLIHITSSELAANYTTEFEEMFLDEEFGPRSPQNTPSERLNINGVPVENYFSPEDNVMDHIRAQVSRAESSIHFLAFSFTYDDLGDVVLDRAENGVEVRGIFEVRGANTEFSECNRLLTAGADVRLDGNPATMHHKVFIIDGKTLVVGSFNFSNNATESNDENLLIIHDPAVASLYEAEFAARMSEAQFPVGGECLTS